jgi:hypothetical protein
VRFRFFEITDRVGLTRFGNPSSHGGYDRTPTVDPNPASGERRLPGHETVDEVERASSLGTKLRATTLGAGNEAFRGWDFGSIKRRQMKRGSDHCGQFASRMNTTGSPNNEKMLTDIRAGSRNASRKT